MSYKLSNKKFFKFCANIFYQSLPYHFRSSLFFNLTPHSKMFVMEILNLT